MCSKIFVLDANPEERLNKRFVECSKFRNLEMAFKPQKIENLLSVNSKILKALENFKMCVSVSCYIFDIYKKKKFSKSFLSILSHENCEVLSSTYYHSIFLDYEEFELQVLRNLENLENLGFDVKGFFSPCVLPAECYSFLSSKFEYAIVNSDMPAFCKKGIVVIPRCCEVDCSIVEYSTFNIPSGEFVFPSEIVKAIENLHPCEDYIVKEELNDFALEAKRALKRCKIYGYSRFYTNVWSRLLDFNVINNLNENFSLFMSVVSCYQLRCSRRMKSRVSALAMRTLPVEKAFYFPHGVAYDVEEFYELLKQCEEDAIKEFIYRNDFSKWIGEVLHDKLLAFEISKCRSKDEVLRVLKNRISFYRRKLES